MTNDNDDHGRPEGRGPHGGHQGGHQGGGDNVAFLRPRRKKTGGGNTPPPGISAEVMAHSWMLALPDLTADETMTQHAVQQLRGLYDATTQRETKIYLLKNVLLMSDAKETADWAAEHLLKFAAAAPIEEALEIYAVVAGDGVHDAAWSGKVADITAALFQSDARYELIDFIEYSEYYDHAHLAEFMADVFLLNFGASTDKDFCIRYANALLRNDDLLTDETREILVTVLVTLIADADKAQAFLKKTGRLRQLKELQGPDTSESTTWSRLLSRAWRGESKTAADEAETSGEAAGETIDETENADDRNLLFFNRRKKSPPSDD